MFTAIVLSVLGVVMIAAVVFAIWWTRQEKQKFKLQQEILQEQHEQRMRKLQSSFDKARHDYKKQMSLYDAGVVGKETVMNELIESLNFKTAKPKQYIITEEPW